MRGAAAETRAAAASSERRAALKAMFPSSRAEKPGKPGKPEKPRRLRGDGAVPSSRSGAGRGDGGKDRRKRG